MNTISAHMLPSADRDRDAMARLIALLNPAAFHSAEPAAFADTARALLGSADECGQLLLAHADMRDEQALPAPDTLDDASLRWLKGVLAERATPHDLDAATLQRLIADPRLLFGYAVHMHSANRAGVRLAAGLPDAVADGIAAEVDPARSVLAPTAARSSMRTAWPIAAAAMISAVISAVVALQWSPTPAADDVGRVSQSNGASNSSQTPDVNGPGANADEAVAPSANVGANTSDNAPATDSPDHHADSHAETEALVARLRQHLDNPDREVRAVSAYHLVSLNVAPDADATGVLVDSLAEDDTRWIGQGGLLQLGTEQLPQIIHAWYELPPERREASRDGLAQVLRLLGRQAVDKLSGALQEPDLPADEADVIKQLLDGVRNFRDELDRLWESLPEQFRRRGPFRGPIRDRILNGPGSNSNSGN